MGYAGVLIIASCFLEDKGPARVARVMDVRGAVQIQSAEGPSCAAALLDPLVRGDRLTVPADGGATLLFFETGAKVRVKAGTTVTIGLAGCEPPEAVTRLKSVSRSVATTLRGLRSPSGQEFGTTSLREAREPNGPEPPAVTPIDSSTVVSERPSLSWKARPDVKTYRVRLRVGGSDRQLWTAEASEPRLAYPPGEAPLRRGRVYLWQVSDQQGRPLVSGRFTVATGPEATKLGEFDHLARSDDPADLLAAAVVYLDHRVDDQALLVYERLTELAPSEPQHVEMLADLYRSPAGPGMPGSSSRRPGPGGKGVPLGRISRGRRLRRDPGSGSAGAPTPIDLTIPDEPRPTGRKGWDGPWTPAGTSTVGRFPMRA